MRIHKLLASEDASKKKAHGDTSKQETSEKEEEMRAREDAVKGRDAVGSKACLEGGGD